MGVSIYYTARRAEPLTLAEQSAIEAAVARHPLSMLLEECGVAEDVYDGEDFCVFMANLHTGPGVVFEGATKLSLYSEDAMWAAVKHWCRLLSDMRRMLPDTAWQVYIDDHEIPWDEDRLEFDPSA